MYVFLVLLSINTLTVYIGLSKTYRPRSTTYSALGPVLGDYNKNCVCLLEQSRKSARHHPSHVGFHTTTRDDRKDTLIDSKASLVYIPQYEYND